MNISPLHLLHKNQAVNHQEGDLHGDRIQQILSTVFGEHLRIVPDRDVLCMNLHGLSKRDFSKAQPQQTAFCSKDVATVSRGRKSTEVDVLSHSLERKLFASSVHAFKKEQNYRKLEEHQQKSLKQHKNTRIVSHFCRENCGTSSVLRRTNKRVFKMVAM